MCESIFPTPQTRTPGAKRCAVGASNVPDKEGGSGRGDEVPTCSGRQARKLKAMFDENIGRIGQAASAAG